MRTKKRYRLNAETAKQLGFSVVDGGRYWLSKEQERKLKEIRGSVQFKRLFIDIETSPLVVYSWRVGSKVNLDYSNIIEHSRIICASWKWEDEDDVMNATWEYGSDHKVVQQIYSYIKEADEVVAHNIDRFDIPKLRTRALEQGIMFRPKLRTADTLKWARHYFKFETNKLDDICEYLNIGRKIKTGFGLWKAVCDGDQQALKDMVAYCDQDVVLLENLFKFMQKYVRPETHVGVHEGNRKWSCPSCGNTDVERLKIDVTPAGTIKNIMKCLSCEHEYPISQTDFSKMITGSI